MEKPLGLRLSLVLGTALLVTSGIQWAQQGTATDEVELTGDWIGTIEPQLASPAEIAKLDIYDRLAFGSGQFVRVEGKSRKSAVFKLTGQGEFRVRLLDLPEFDLKLLSPRTEYHFGGVLSKIDRAGDGHTEVNITYANVSEVQGRFYSRQAQEFVLRTQQLKRQNERIEGQATEAISPSQKPSAEASPRSESTAARSPGPSSPKSQADAAGSSTPAPSPPSSGPKPSTRAESQKSQKPDPDVDGEEAPEPPKNRPVLKRRVESDKPPAEAEPVKDSTSPELRQSPGEDDVVIYRRREGSRQSSTGARSAPPPPESPDRPVLRRNTADRQEEKEVDGMMLIPDGYVSLGSDEASDAERPQHRFRVKTFYMDKHEVTNRDYKQFCDATGHPVPPYWNNKSYPIELETHPVVQVSWLDASAFARWAGKRLPTEAEWERAAKGPNSYRYAYGNAYDPQKANTNKQKTSAVGSYPANEFGLFDMTGNVLEWTSSLFGPYPYQDSDGREDAKAAGPRVLRGGSHSSSETDARCLVRKKELPDHGSPLLGFRCARNAS
jgi:formylglycine-generating enzyme required for sulfatase activity